MRGTATYPVQKTRDVWHCHSSRAYVRDPGSPLRVIPSNNTTVGKGIAVEDEKIIESFHLMWDTFPGLARLIDANHTVIASNPIAQSKGFVQGSTCAKVGDPASHRGCKLAKALQSGETVTDNELSDRIRGWMPVPGHEDLCVHFAILLPTES